MRNACPGPGPQVTTRNLGAAIRSLRKRGSGDGRRDRRRLLGALSCSTPSSSMRRRGVQSEHGGVRADRSRKSAFVKTFLWRQPSSGAGRGGRSKGEYSDLADAWASVPSPSDRRAIRLNPLDPGPTPTRTATPRGRQRSQEDGAALLAGQRLPGRACCPRAGRLGRRWSKPPVRPKCPPCPWSSRRCSRPRRTRPLAAHRATRPP